MTNQILQQALEALESTKGYMSDKTSTAKEVQSAIEALRSALAQQGGPVAGFKLVPIEPTEQMEIAGALAYEQSKCHDNIGPLEDAYRAMLAAAPAAQQGEQQQQPDTWTDDGGWTFPIERPAAQPIDTTAQRVAKTENCGHEAQPVAWDDGQEPLVDGGLLRSGKVDAACRDLWSRHAPTAQPVGINGLTDAETDASASVRGLIATAAQQPIFWYRPRSDGFGYEGPVHDEDIERVRRESGAWVPLFAGAAPAAQPIDTTAKRVEETANCGHDAQPKVITEGGNA